MKHLSDVFHLYHPEKTELFILRSTFPQDLTSEDVIKPYQISLLQNLKKCFLFLDILTLDVSYSGNFL